MEDKKRQRLLNLFLTIERYYGVTIEIASGLYSVNETYSTENATWNFSEFKLAHSTYRHDGNKIKIEGEKMFYEFSVPEIIDFKHPKPHHYEVVESYEQTLFRITKIKFVCPK